MVENIGTYKLYIFSGNKFDPVNGTLVEYLNVQSKSIFSNSEAQSRAPKAVMCGFVALKG